MSFLSWMRIHPILQPGTSQRLAKPPQERMGTSLLSEAKEGELHPGKTWGPWWEENEAQPWSGREQRRQTTAVLVHFTVLHTDTHLLEHKRNHTTQWSKIFVGFFHFCFKSCYLWMSSLFPWIHKLNVLLTKNPLQLRSNLIIYHLNMFEKKDELKKNCITRVFFLSIFNNWGIRTGSRTIVIRELLSPFYLSIKGYISIKKKFFFKV